MSTIYEQHIIFHSRNTTHFGVLPNANCLGDAHNRSCGDTAMLQLCVENGIVVDAKSKGSGCALSLAAQSILIEHILGKTMTELSHMHVSDMYNLLQIQISPTRSSCALMGYSALRDALKHYEITH
jgi:nitrogen fixation NifU-like protein